MPRQYIRIPVADRLWARVIKTPTCWTWTGSTDRKGYGKIGVPPEQTGKSRIIAVHRIAWELADGHPIPDGIDVLHTCDTPLCLRNDEQGTYEVNGVLLPRWGHLFLGTNAQNTQDMLAKGRSGMTGPRLPHQIKRGATHPGAKLSAAEVLWIRSEVAGGRSQKELARLLQVSPATICMIAARKLWQHI